jgi:hypothetical protein
MSVLNTLNITSAQLQKINPDLYEAYLDIQEVKKRVDEGLSDSNLLKVYNSSLREIETYLLSEQFLEEAKNKGITLRSSQEAKTIQAIEEPDDIDMSVLEALYGEGVSVVEKEPAEAPAEEPEQEPAEEPEEQPIDVEGLYEKKPDEEVTEKPAEEEDEEEEEEQLYEAEYGYRYNVDAKKNIDVPFNNIEKIISYGGNDYSLKYFESDDSFNYMYTLPLSQGRIIISYNIAFSQFKQLKDYNAIKSMSRRMDRDSSSSGSEFTIYLVSELKEELKALNEILMSQFKTDSNEQRESPKAITPLGKANFGDDNLDEYNYEQVNSVFDYFESAKFIDMQSEISKNWNLLFDSPKFEYVKWEITYGNEGGTLYKVDGKSVTYEEYDQFRNNKPKFLTGQNNFATLQKVYMPINYVFQKTGNFVQTNNQVFYTPIGRKSDLVYDIGKHFKQFGINTKNYDRDTGKISKTEFNNLASCRISYYEEYRFFDVQETAESKENFDSFTQKKKKQIDKGEIEYTTEYQYVFEKPAVSSRSSTEGTACVINDEGRVIYVNALSLNHFIKYYGAEIELKSSDNYLCVFQEDEMVGFMPITQSRNYLYQFNRVLQVSELSSTLRGDHTQVYDFMIPFTDIISAEYFGISKEDEIPSPTPIVSQQEVEEMEKESEDFTDDELEGLYGTESTEKPKEEETEEEVDEETKQAVEDIELEIDAISDLREDLKDDKETYEELGLELDGLKELYEILTGKKYEDEN